MGYQIKGNNTTVLMVGAKSHPH